MREIKEFDTLYQNRMNNGIAIPKDIRSLVYAYNNAREKDLDYIDIGYDTMWSDEEVDAIVNEMKKLGIKKFVYGAVSSFMWERLYRFVQDGAKIEGIEMVVTRRNAIYNAEKFKNAFDKAYKEGKSMDNISYKEYYDDEYKPALVLTLE